MKIGEFEPADIGQLQFYLEALDRTVKKPNEQSSIGVLLCAAKNREVVEFALNRTLSPTLVADYQVHLPDKRVLEQKLHEFYSLVQGADPPPAIADKPKKRPAKRKT